MEQEYLEYLRSQANQVKNATREGENTATRVGQLFLSIIDAVETASLSGGVGIGGGNDSVDLSGYATHQWVDEKLSVQKQWTVAEIQKINQSKLDKSTFDELFERVNIGTDSNGNPQYAIRAKLGLYSDYFLSAKGCYDGLSTGGDSASDIDLSNYATKKWVQDWVGTQGFLTEIPGRGGSDDNNGNDIDLSGYATQSWVNIKLDNYALKEHTHDYLGLSAGDNRYVKKDGDVMTGLLVVPQLKIADAYGNGITLLYDNTSNGIRIMGGGLYADTFISAKGIGDEGNASSAGLDEQQLKSYLASKCYLTQTVADDRYASKNHEHTNYLSKNEALSVYLSRDAAANTYIPKNGGAEWDKDNRCLWIGDEQIFVEWAGSAKQLDASHNLWGQSFDGSSDISGDINGVGNITRKDDGKQYGIGSRQVHFYESWIDNSHNNLVLPYSDNTGNVGLEEYSFANIFAYNIYAKTSVTIGEIELLYDGKSKGLRVKGGGLYADTYLSAKGQANIIDPDLELNRLSLTAADGIAPMVIASSTCVANLNADMVDGKHVSDLFESIDLTDGKLQINIGGKIKSIDLPTSSASGSTTIEAKAYHSDRNGGMQVIYSDSSPLLTIKVNGVQTSTYLPSPSDYGTVPTSLSGMKEILPTTEDYSSSQLGSNSAPWSNAYITTLNIGSSMTVKSNGTRLFQVSSNLVSVGNPSTVGKFKVYGDIEYTGDLKKVS